MTTPKPVRAERGWQHTGGAVVALFDLLGRRWALRILWELGQSPLSSRALSARCGGVSPTVLHRRLKELRDASLVNHAERRGYTLSLLGVGLLRNLQPLKGWAGRWARRSS
jgi:DNA-binding HxlR family transcriptional regulator